MGRVFFCSGNWKCIWRTEEFSLSNILGESSTTLQHDASMAGLFHFFSEMCQKHISNFLLQFPLSENKIREKSWQSGRILKSTIKKCIKLTRQKYIPHNNSTNGKLTADTTTNLPWKDAYLKRGDKSALIVETKVKTRNKKFKSLIWGYWGHFCLSLWNNKLRMQRCTVFFANIQCNPINTVFVVTACKIDLRKFYHDMRNLHFQLCETPFARSP